MSSWSAAVTPDPNQLVCVGGTGKIVGLAYLRIGKLLGWQPNVSVIDFPPGQEGYTDIDRLMDEALLREGLSSRISSLPDAMPHIPDNLKQTLGLDEHVANAILTADQQATPPVKGANQQPQVGATLAHLKIARDEATLQTQWFQNSCDDVFFIAGLGGGTGAGFAPVLIDFAKRKSNKRVHAVFLIPWQKIGTQDVGDSGQARNTRSLLRYIDGLNQTQVDHVILIGSAPGIPPYISAGNGEIPVQPSLLLAALCILMNQNWGGMAQLALHKRRMEVAASGIRLDDITGPRGSLFDMLLHSRRLELCLKKIVAQMPHYRLSGLSLRYLSKSLCWDSIEYYLKAYADRANVSYEIGWNNMVGGLEDYIRQESARREWIMKLAASSAELIAFDPNDVETNARTNLDEYLAYVESKDERRNLQLDSDAEVTLRSEVCSTIRNRASDLLFEMMTRRPRS